MNQLLLFPFLFLWCRLTRYFRFPLIGWESQRYFNVSLIYWWKLTTIRNQLDFLLILYTKDTEQTIEQNVNFFVNECFVPN